MTMSAADAASAEPGVVPRWSRARVLAGVGLALTLLLVGYVVGLRSPWSAHAPTIVHGTVDRVRSVQPYGIFTPDGGGDLVEFRLDGIVWRSEKLGTDSGTIPACLRQEDASIQAEVGLIEVDRPFGSGSYWMVLSLTCPPGY